MVWARRVLPKKAETCLIIRFYTSFPVMHVKKSKGYVLNGITPIPVKFLNSVTTLDLLDLQCTL